MRILPRNNAKRFSTFVAAEIVANVLNGLEVEGRGFQARETNDGPMIAIWESDKLLGWYADDKED